MKLLLAFALTFSILLPLRASRWTLTTSGFQTVHWLSNDRSGALFFDVPGAGSSANYLYGPSTALSVGQTLTATWTITGTGTFHFTEGDPCGDPPSARLFLWANRKGNNGWADNDRWWAWDTPVALTAGTFTVSVPLDWTRWVNVWSDSDPTAFATALAASPAVGLTFGGATCNYGHGIYVTGGPTRFTLDSYTVN